MSSFPLFFVGQDFVSLITTLIDLLVSVIAISIIQAIAPLTKAIIRGLMTVTSSFYHGGPRIDLAIALIDRMKKLFVGSSKYLTFDTKETIIELNNAKIEAFPSHHLDAMRGLPNVSFILSDEANFFPRGQPYNIL
jgi:hypothetical protein